MREKMAKLSFETVFDQTQARIRAYIAGMGIPPYEVDDLAQEVYLELYRNLDKMPAKVPAVRWLKGIARNLCLNHIRRTSRRARLHREALAEILAQVESPQEQLVGEDSLRHALDECCRRLPDENRRMLAMRYEQDLPSLAIAEAIGSTAEAIRVALYRIRARLKDCISHILASEG